MKTLYLDSSDQGIEVGNKRLVIRCLKRDSIIVTVPTSQIREIVAFGDVALSTKTLRNLGKQSISLVCLNRTDSDSKMLCHNIDQGNILRKLRQFSLIQDENKSLALSQYLLFKKTERHIAMLNKCAQDTPDKAPAMHFAMSQLESLKNSIFETSSTASLLGTEGSAARIYFRALANLIAPEWQFTGRQKRPCKDPFNALLSITYSLVHWEFVRQLYGRGLDPYLGFFHKPTYGRESLACDGIELLRPEIDYWVLQLTKNEELNVFDFKNEHGAVALRSVARPVFFKLYNEQSIKWRKRVRAYVDLFCSTIDEYEASVTVA